MAYFTVPADFKLSTVEEIKKLNLEIPMKVEEVYGSSRNSRYGSGRRFTELPQTSETGFAEYIAACTENNINFNYTLNMSCNANLEYSVQGQMEVLNHVEDLIKLGVRYLTITIPALVDLIYHHFPEIHITLSVVSAVDSVKKAEYFASNESIKALYVHESLNRKPRILEPVVRLCRSQNKEVGTIINTMCLSDCPFRISHYNQSAHSDNSNSHLSEYYGIKCAFIRLNDKTSILRSPWIRPDDVKFYSNLGINKFKISGREMFRMNADMLKVISVYNAGTFTGNLVDLFQCFSDSTVARIFKVDNSKELDRYMSLVLKGKTGCSMGDCLTCKTCEKSKELVEVNKKEAKVWEQILDMELNKFRNPKRKKNVVN